MLDAGPQPDIAPADRPLATQATTETDRRNYLLSASAALVLMLLALSLSVWNGPAGNLLGALVQFGAGLLVFGFTVGGDWLTWQNRLKPELWQRGALVCAAVVVVAGMLTGEYFNLMLAPLLVGYAQRHQHARTVFKFGLAAAGLVVAEILVFTIFKIERQTMGLPGTSLIVLAALTLSLVRMMSRYQSEVQSYREEASAYRTEAANKASEMEVAHEIQTSLMPPNMFNSGDWTLAARSLPARDVGGDFYEYVHHPTIAHTISGIAIGDVAGKGIPAALQMAVVRTLFRVEARRRIFPGETLMSVNVALQAERSFGMVTMLYAFIDINNNTLHLANAGHNYPLILNGTLDEIKLPGLPLGIDEGIEYEEQVIKITPGTSVIFYTDGVVEAMTHQDELFTFERLKETVYQNRELGPGEMVDKILEEITTFTQGAPQSDDITILVLQYHPQDARVDEDFLPEQAEPVGVAAGEGRGLTRPGQEVEVDENGINWI